MNTGLSTVFTGPCSWLPGSQALPAPRNDRDIAILYHRSVERALDARPIFDCPLLAGCNRDDNLAPTGAAHGLYTLLQFLLAGGEGGAADQLGGDEFALLGLDEQEMAAVVGQIARIRRLVMAGHLDIPGDFGGDFPRNR